MYLLDDLHSERWYVRKLQKLSTDLAATLQGPVRCKQDTVNDRCDSEDASNDGTGPRVTIVSILIKNYPLHLRGEEVCERLSRLRVDHQNGGDVVVEEDARNATTTVRDL